MPNGGRDIIEPTFPEKEIIQIKPVEESESSEVVEGKTDDAQIKMKDIGLLLRRSTSPELLAISLGIV